VFALAPVRWAQNTVQLPEIPQWHAAGGKMAFDVASVKPVTLPQVSSLR
jgi:hypothetical protein